MYNVTEFESAGFLTSLLHDSIQHGWTSLMKASFQGHNEVVELLLAAGANTDLKNQVSLCREKKRSPTAKNDGEKRSSYLFAAMHVI